MSEKFNGIVTSGVCEVMEWEETWNCSKSVVKWRNISEISLVTTIGLESNPFIFFNKK